MASLNHASNIGFDVKIRIASLQPADGSEINAITSDGGVHTQS
jgi:hypothetical protein